KALCRDDNREAVHIVCDKPPGSAGALLSRALTCDIASAVANDHARGANSMIRFRSSLPAASLLALALSLAPAQAQMARTFVSSVNGNDANDCSQPTPCRTFQAAHDKTFDGGEVAVLSTGGYGALTITKSISIVSEAGEASILVSGGATGISINASAASYVNLRGITVQGIGFGGGTGLRLNSGQFLT